MSPRGPGVTTSKNYRASRRQDKNLMKESAGPPAIHTPAGYEDRNSAATPLEAAGRLLVKSSR